MMPFSILRPWFLGTLSWLLLGVGVYCGWLALEEYRHSAQSEVTIDRSGGKDVPQDRVRPGIDDERLPPRDSQPRESGPKLSTLFWAYLTASVVLLGLNFGGFLVVPRLLGNPGGPEREQVPPAKQVWLDRPDGSRLNLQIHGADNAATIVLTHGWSLDISAWDYVIGQLSRRCRVVTWDLPGLGQSRGPSNSDLSLEKMAHDLHAVLERTANGETVVLAGHSIGGMITQVFSRLYANQLGTRVQGLALLQTTYVNPLRTCFAAPLATALEWPLVTPFNYFTLALAPWVWLSNLQSYLNGSLHLVSRLTTFSGRQSWQQLDHAALLAVKAWPGILARGNLAMQRFHDEKTLREIEIPVLVLSGEHDRMTLPTASDHMEHLLAADQPCRLSAGHLGMWERPEEFVRALSAFVELVEERDSAISSTSDKTKGSAVGG